MDSGTVCEICGRDATGAEHDAAACAQARRFEEERALLFDRYRVRPREARLEMPFEVALARANALREEPGVIEPGEALEAPTWWYLPLGWIGCVGILVDKADGRAHVLGSGLGLDDWFWGYTQGYRDDRVFVLEQVLDRERALELLAGLRVEGLVELPHRARLSAAERTDAVLAMRRRQRNAVSLLRERQLAAIVDGTLPLHFESHDLAWNLPDLRADAAEPCVRYRFVPAR